MRASASEEVDQVRAVLPYVNHTIRHAPEGCITAELFCGTYE
ncbi:hypothetical protein GTY87_27685 [Streptomyces sp. SID7813]|uniref:Uncharacterized protein n=1 Tax=Streptomyces coelicolor (strain ATCC BAA-471 / A3(2) / M145) TaxID=100226 RepID=Q9L2B0_STRCO|nr:hypothetical protein [Streptomyces sp. SID7813]QFI45290.1 hypothetical protein FQ762_27945 [Streptomyces coelicolor A3(2)]CAB70640.1 hypothetical protein SC8F4.14c [Streptomyces coelicolor A3(2)]